MRARDDQDLRHATALLAAAMSTGAILSACKPTPAPAVTPETNAPAANDVEALRRAAAVLRDWQQRDPARAESVLREQNLFVCDSTTTACMAARSVADSARQPPPPLPPPGSPPETPQGQGIQIPTRDSRTVRDSNDQRVPMA